MPVPRVLCACSEHGGSYLDLVTQVGQPDLHVYRLWGRRSTRQTRARPTRYTLMISGGLETLLGITYRRVTDRQIDRLANRQAVKKTD